MGSQFISTHRGEAHHSAKLTVANVREMRELHYTNNVSIRDLSRIYEITYAVAWSAIRFVTWVHVRD